MEPYTYRPYNTFKPSGQSRGEQFRATDRRSLEELAQQKEREEQFY